MDNQIIQKNISIIFKSLNPIPKPFPKPLLIILVGLPGTGKTFLGEKLKEDFPVSIVQSDKIRAICFTNPKYTNYENKYVFDLCHKVINNLLQRKIPVLLDATNLLEKNRQGLYEISKFHNAKLLVLKITAERKITKLRISRRLSSKSNVSKASWNVYRRLGYFNDPIGIQHSVIDNSINNTVCLEPILEELVAWRNSLYP